MLIGPYHPFIVHFAIGLLVVGVLFRWAALVLRSSFAGPAALTLILLGTGAAVLSVVSGTQAHGPVEQVPGSREAVVEHEAWGLRTRNVFLAVTGLEIVALSLLRWGRSRPVHVASGIAGLVGLFCLYEAGDHGGRLVYSYAGGVGIRQGDPADVGRLLLAGLYHQAQLDRKAGRATDAAALLAQAGRRFPENLEVQLVAAESRLLDVKDPSAALAALRGITVPDADPRLRLRHGLLTVDALEAAGQRDGALALLQTLVAQFPNDERLNQRARRLSEGVK